jgi:hypothetical protein
VLHTTLLPIVQGQLGQMGQMGQIPGQSYGQQPFGQPWATPSPMGFGQPMGAGLPGGFGI